MLFSNCAHLPVKNSSSSFHMVTPFPPPMDKVVVKGVQLFPSLCLSPSERVVLLSLCLQGSDQKNFAKILDFGLRENNAIFQRPRACV